MWPAEAGVWPAPIYLLLAAGLDMVAGQAGLLGRIPPTERIAERLADWCSRSLNPDSLVNGYVLLIGHLALWGGLGWALDRWVAPHWQAAPLLVLLLARTLHQRETWRAMVRLGRRLDRASEGDRHAGVRLGLTEGLRRLSDGFIADALAFLLAGFTGLLAWRGAMALAARPGEAALVRTAGPLTRPAAQLTHMVGLIPGTLSWALLRGVVGRRGRDDGPTQSAAANPAPVYPAGALSSHADHGHALVLLPSGAMAHALSVQFRVRTDQATLWFGPADGRARADVVDLIAGGRLLKRAYAAGVLGLALAAGASAAWSAAL